MLHKCANPDCTVPFRRLDAGKLFQVEIEPSPTALSGRNTFARKSRPLRHVERFWLCDQCSLTFTLMFERGRGVVAVRLPSVREKTAQTVRLREFPLAARDAALPTLAAHH